MEKLSKVDEFLEEWIKGTEEIIHCVELLRKAVEESRNLEEFRKKAEEIIEKTPEWFKEEVRSIVDAAISEV